MYSNKRCIKHSRNVLVTEKNCPNIDFRYGPYPSVEKAYSELSNLECIAVGLTVGIEKDGVITEYWFKDGKELSNLVLKFSESSSEINSLKSTINSLLKRIEFLESLHTGEDIPVTETTRFEDLIINTVPVSVSAIPYTGGSATIGLVDYTYNFIKTINGVDLNTIVKIDGGTITYSTTASNVVISEDGIITVGQNPSEEDTNIDITVKVTLSDGTFDTEIITLTQSGLVSTLPVAYFGYSLKVNLVGYDINAALEEAKEIDTQKIILNKDVVTKVLNIDIETTPCKTLWFSLPDGWEVSSITNAIGDEYSIKTLESDSNIYYDFNDVDESRWNRVLCISGPHTVKISKI